MAKQVPQYTRILHLHQSHEVREVCQAPSTAEHLGDLVELALIPSLRPAVGAHGEELIVGTLWVIL